jgi:ribosomal protein S18 acetylase RimI-like enzyme
VPLRLRPVTASDAAALADILVIANEHAFRGIVPDQCLALTEAQSAANWQRTLDGGIAPADIFDLVEDAANQRVGYVWAGPSDDATHHGRIRQIMILPAHQRQGIGRLLVRRAALHLAARGIRSLDVEVLQCNPNRPFYERLGARFLSDRPYDWDGIILPMCRYGWNDTRPLLTAR